MRIVGIVMYLPIESADIKIDFRREYTDLEITIGSEFCQRLYGPKLDFYTQNIRCIRPIVGRLVNFKRYKLSCRMWMNEVKLITIGNRAPKGTEDPKDS